jgi:ABC-type transporter Mla maintaining outer membrane lipid asymmetry ATPase subunit MlaF
VLKLSNLSADRTLSDAQIVLGSGKSLVSGNRQENTEQADVSIRNFWNGRSTKSSHTLKTINVYVDTP